MAKDAAQRVLDTIATLCYATEKAARAEALGTRGAQSALRTKRQAIRQLFELAVGRKPSVEELARVLGGMGADQLAG